MSNPFSSRHAGMPCRKSLGEGLRYPGEDQAQDICEVWLNSAGFKKTWAVFNLGKPGFRQEADSEGHM